jgi:hypothetical protein
MLLRYKEVNKSEPLEPISLQELEDELRSSQPPSPETWRPRGTKLSAEQVQEVITKEPGNISPQMAELRADLGNAATSLSQFQTFDGPAPETINGRLAMLGVVVGLLGEWVTGLGLLEQTGDHPITVFAAFLFISFASYAPIARGYTRKEPFANRFLGLSWSPKAENWNGRLAMLGFTGMIVTEAITGVNTLQAWGLQSLLHHMNM